jgi:hypothetical protein
VTTTATLDAEYVQQQMRLLIPLIEECHAHAVERLHRAANMDESGLLGRLWVRFSIVGDPDVGGLIGDSRIVDDKTTVADAGLRECVQETMYAARFPPPRENGEVVIDYPFVFAAGDSQLTMDVLQAFREHRYRDVLTMAPRLEDRAMATRFRGVSSCALHDRDGARAAWSALDESGRQGLEKFCAGKDIKLP